MSTFFYRIALVLTVSAYCSAAGQILQSVDGSVQPKREFRAVWVATVENLDFPASRTSSPDQQKSELVAMLDKLSAAGINAIIFQVRPECDALYQSTREPWSYWLTGVQGVAPNPLYDPLQFAVDEVHKRGMEIHAWFNPYRAVKSVGQYNVNAGHVSVLHPEWILTFPAIRQKLLNPGLPQVREHVTNVVMDVVRRYDIDGVHFDDYFYPYPATGFSGITFEDDATFASYSRGFSDRGEWRRDNVNLLIGQIHDSLHAVKPYLRFGIGPFGIWKSGVPAGTSGMSAYNVIYCDAIAWLKQRTIDYITPQLYWQLGGPQDYGLLMPWWADSAATYGRHFYPGQAAYRVGSWSASELPNQIRLTRANPKAGGSVFFRANSGVADNPLGLADTLKAVLYRFPALIPAMDWKDIVLPYPPRGISYEKDAASGRRVIRWEAPLGAPDGETATRYAIYRLDHRPTALELTDPSNIIGIQAGRAFLPPVPSVPGSYYYVVTALDRNWNEGDTSNIVVASPPPAPLQIQPIDAAADQGISPRLVWSATDGADSYRVRVSTDPTFTSGVVFEDSMAVDTSSVARGLLGQRTYYWQVAARNAGGQGPWSVGRSFFSAAPASPVLLFPADSSTGLTETIQFRWSRVTSATSYRLQLSEGFDFTAIVADVGGIPDTATVIGPLQTFKTHSWRVMGMNTFGEGSWGAIRRFRTGGVSGTGERVGLPEATALYQNYPNPFNPFTTIRYDLAESAMVRLTVCDILGREVDRPVDGHQGPGSYTVVWNGQGHASGMYFIRLSAGSHIAVRRMMFIK